MDRSSRAAAVQISLLNRVRTLDGMPVNGW
jgi:hypothetical protein